MRRDAATPVDATSMRRDARRRHLDAVDAVDAVDAKGASLSKDEPPKGAGGVHPDR